MKTTEREIEAIAQILWPDREVYVGRNMVGNGENPPLGFVCFVTDDMGKHVVRPMKGDTIEELKDNVYVRAVETAVKENLPTAQIDVRRIGGGERWGVVFLGASRLNFEADSLFELTKEAVRRFSKRDGAMHPRHEFHRADAIVIEVNAFKQFPGATEFDITCEGQIWILRFKDRDGVRREFSRPTLQMLVEHSESLEDPNGN
jgi:hypothetical protein